MAAKPKKKLKVLHWKKVPNNKIPASIWDGLQAAPGPLVARDALELVFFDEPKESNKAAGKPASAAGAGGAAQKVSLLDLRRAQTVGIMLSRFKLPLDAVARAIQRMDARALTLDDVIAVGSYLPTDDEVTMLEGFKGDPLTLAPPDLHFWHLMRIPLLQRRLEAFRYLLSFDSRVRALRASIKNIQQACQEVLSSNELRFVLATVLGVGNTLNEGTFAGNARGFKVELLLRLAEVKSAGLPHYASRPMCLPPYVSMRVCPYIYRLRVYAYICQMTEHEPGCVALCTHACVHANMGPGIRWHQSLRRSPCIYTYASFVCNVSRNVTRSTARVCSSACVRACMRACVHACVRTCVRACMRACVHACMCTRACVCYTHKHTRAHTHTHTHMQTRKQTARQIS